MGGTGTRVVRIAAVLSALAGIALLAVFLLQDPTPAFGARTMVVPDRPAPVPMRLIRGVHPVITAEVDGHTLNLLVDTGTPATMVPPELAEGDSDRGVASLCLENGICAEDLAVSFYPSFYSHADGNTYNGVLGADILTRFSVTFDYARGELRFGESAEDSAVKVPFTVDRNVKPRLAIEIGGERFGGVLLDTGASYTRLQPRMLEALGPERRGRRREIAYFLDTQAETEVFVADRFCLADACVPDIQVQGGDWAAVGATFFRDFVVVFDFPNETLGLTPTGAPRPVSALERRGVQVDINDGGLVSQITPGSAAARAGLKTGDRIAEVGGVSAGDLGYFGVNARLEAPGTVTMTMDDGRSVTID